jgi:hypothetical protein
MTSCFIAMRRTPLAALAAVLSACASIGDGGRTEEATAEVAAEEGQVFAIVEVDEAGVPTTTTMFAPEGVGPDGWRPLGGDAADLPPGTYRITGRPDGDLWIVDKAESLAAAPAQLGVENPNA